MANVLKLDCTSAGAALIVDIGTPVSSCWVTMPVAYSSAYLTWLGAQGFNGDWFHDIYSGDYSVENQLGNAPGGGTPSWYYALSGGAFTWATVAATLTPLQAYLVEIHLVAGTPLTREIFVDGVSFGTLTTTEALADIEHFELATIGVASVGSAIYLTSYKVGTTRGGSDIFSDDFTGSRPGGWNEFYHASRAFIVADPGITPPAGPPPDPLPHWYVIHREHEVIPDTVGMPDIIDTGDAGAVINTIRPENLHFVLRLGVLGPEDADYELANTALDEDTGDPVVTADFVGAYRTDFEIYRSDIEDPILAGMHVEAPAGDDGEQPNDHSRIAGKGFLHYLEKRVWPYDADLSYVDWPTGFRFNVAAAEVGAMVKDILETVRDVSPNYPSPPDAPGTTSGLFSYSLGYTVDADDTGISRNYEISAFDASTIYDLVQSLAQAHKEDGGFDFYMTWDKVFKLVAPEIGTPGSPIFTLQVDATTLIPNMIEAGFRNVGPDATHVLGVGAGTSNRQGGVNKHSRENSARYRRLDRVADFGNVKNLDELEGLTADALVAGVQPVHEIPITVNTDDIPSFWTITRPGEYIEVIYDFGWHAVNSVQRIVEMDCTVSLEGLETVVLSLNQHYDLDPADGIVDW